MASNMKPGTQSLEDFRAKGLAVRQTCAIERKARVLELYKRGMHKATIAKELGVALRTVYRDLDGYDYEQNL